MVSNSSSLADYISRLGEQGFGKLIGDHRVLELLGILEQKIHLNVSMKANLCIDFLGGEKIGGKIRR